MRELKKTEDRTLGGYGSILKRYMGEVTQTEWAKQLGIPMANLNGLIRGRNFPSNQIIEQFIHGLGIPTAIADRVKRNIRLQRLYPVIKDPFIGPRLRAIRVIRGLGVSDMVSKGISASTLSQVEGGLVTVGPKRMDDFRKALNIGGVQTEEQKATIDYLLNNYTTADLLTVGYYLINQYENQLRLPEEVKQGE